MNILDENILLSQRDQLRARKVHFRQVGMEIGRSGMKDRNDIIPLLHTLHRPTFFSCDHGFYRAQLCHAGYCLVWLEVLDDEAAAYIRRLLRHQAFRTQAQRMGKVVKRILPRVACLPVFNVRGKSALANKSPVAPGDIQRLKEL